MDRLAALNRRRRRLIFAYAVCLAPVIVYGAAQALKTNSNSPLTWVPPSFPARAAYNRFVERFGTGEVLVASWPGCRIDRPELDDLLKLLRDDPAFRDAQGHRLFERITCGRELIRSLTQGPRPVAYETAVRRFQGSLIGPDGRQTCIVVAFSATALEQRDRWIRALVERIRRTTGAQPHDIHLAGPVIDGWSVNRAGQQSLSKLGPLSAAITLLLAYVCLGTVRHAVIVFGISVVCQAVTLALVHFSGEPMNALLIVLPPLIQVLAIAGGVHLTNYYFDCLHKHGPQQAPRRAVRMGWLPCLLSSGTTALGIGSLMASRLSPIHSFGVFGCAGVLVVFGLLILVMPAVWTMWSQPPETASGNLPNRRRQALAGKATFWVGKLWPAIIGAACTAMAVLGLFLKDLNTSVHIETLFRHDSRILRDYRWLEAHVGPMASVDVVVSWPQESPTPPVARMRLLWNLEQAVASVEGVGGRLSALQLFSALPPRSKLPPDVYYRALTELIERHRRLFRQAGFLSQDGRREAWRISARVSATAQTDYAALLDRLRQAIGPELAHADDASEIEVLYTGVMPLVHEVQKQLLRDLLGSFLGALGLISVVMTIVQGGLLAGLLAMVPNIFPIVVLFGWLGWRQWPIDIGTVMTASVALGIAVDDTFHFLTFFQRADQQGCTRTESVRFAYQHCASAMIQTSVICGLGMLVFAWADFLPTSRFAWMVSLMIVLALWADLCLLPAILLSPLGRLLTSTTRADRAVKADTVPAPHSACALRATGRLCDTPRQRS